MARLSILQVARAVAANAVVVCHLSSITEKHTGPFYRDDALYGIAGVDLFFVLSGFIMAAVAGRQTTPGAFLLRRAARIYPAYWLVTLVVLAAAIARPEWVNASVQTEISIWKSFLLWPQEMTLLMVGWTLMHEVYFYLVFALILALRAPLLTGLAAWLAAIVCAWLLLPADILAENAAVRIATSPMTLEFMIGALVGIAFLRKRMPFYRTAAAVGVGALVAVWTFGPPGSVLLADPNLAALRVVMFGLPCAALLYALVAWESQADPRPPALLVNLGDWSYATYLTHLLVISALGRIVGASLPDGTISTWILVLGGLVASNAVGAMMFIWFERPAARFATALFDSKRGNAPSRPRRAAPSIPASASR